MVLRDLEGGKGCGTQNRRGAWRLTLALLGMAGLIWLVALTFGSAQASNDLANVTVATEQGEQWVKVTCRFEGRETIKVKVVSGDAQHRNETMFTVGGVGGFVECGLLQTLITSPLISVQFMGGDGGLLRTIPAAEAHYISATATVACSPVTTTVVIPTIPTIPTIPAIPTVPPSATVVAGAPEASPTIISSAPLSPTRTVQFVYLPVVRFDSAGDGEGHGETGDVNWNSEVDPANRAWSGDINP